MEDQYRFQDSDSDDELLMFIAARGRSAKTVRPRVDHFTYWNDTEFVMRFRLTKQTVLLLLHQIDHMVEHPTDRNDSVSAINQLLLTLRYFATGNIMMSAGDSSGVHRSTAGQIVKRVTVAIATLGPRYIQFPDTQAGIREVQLGFERMNRVPRVLAAIDCTHIRIKSTGGNLAEVYRNRKGWFSFNVQTLCDHKLRIMDVVARWVGSAHDQNIFNSLAVKARWEMGEFGDAIIFGDSGYCVQPYLLTPLRNPQRSEETIFNEAQIRTRSTVERSYGVWKRRFLVLSLGIRTNVEHVQAIIVACAVLHNLAIDQNEAEPPIDPALPPVDIVDDQIARDLAGGDRTAVQRAYVEYFRTLMNAN